ALGGSLSINSLRFGAADTVSTVDIGAGNRLLISSGGILVSPDVGTGAASITGGILLGAVGTAAELVVHQHNTAAPFTIASQVGGATIINKTGFGTLELTGFNVHRGVTAVTNGVLSVGAHGVGPYSQVQLKHGTLDINNGTALT